MHFTLHKDDKIDNQILEYLNFACERIVVSLPVQVTAIILYGAFGRGEGRVIVHSGKVQIINDLDLIVITELCEREITKRIYEVRSKLNDEFKSIGFPFIDIKFLNSESLSQLDFTMDNFDIKNGGIVIWGKSDVLDQMPNYNASLMPWHQGRRLLLNRLITFLESRIPLDESPCDIADSFCFYQCSKVFFACVDAHLIENGCYVTRYTEKTEAFRKLNKESFLNDLAEKSLEIKAGTSFIPTKGALTFWHEIGEIFVKTLSWYFNGKHEFQRALSGRGLLDDYHFYIRPIKKIIFWILGRPIHSQRQYLETIELLILFSYFDRKTNVQCCLNKSRRCLLEYTKRYDIPMTFNKMPALEELHKQIVNLWHKALHLGESPYERWFNQSINCNSL